MIPRVRRRSPGSSRSEAGGDFTAVLEAAEAFVDGDYT
jgi:hypothetical protein